MLELKLDWEQVRDRASTKILSLQYFDESQDIYRVFAVENSVVFYCRILKTDPRNDDQIDFEDSYKNNCNKSIAHEITPLTPKNNHSSQPWGATKGKFTCSDRACSITLSNKSQDGLTFNYSSTLTPRVGDYVFQDDFCKRSWIVAVDTQNSSITFDDETVKPTLDNGSGVYTQGYWMGVDVPDWSNPMYLWGLVFKFYYSNNQTSKNDFVELSIVDSNNFFKDNTFCQQIFGVATAQDAVPYLEALGFEDNGEYGHWTKYYDESWVCTSEDKIILTPDGAPGELMSHLETRISVFTTKTDNTTTEIFLDYFPTAKD